MKRRTVSTTTRIEVVDLRIAEDTAAARSVARNAAVEAGFSPVDLTRLVTAASELARNTIIHGRGGAMTMELLQDAGRSGVRLTFEDHGPGIPDIARALQNGYTTGPGLGFGLGGSRRLVDEFEISSQVAVGTRVSILRWQS